MIKEQADELLRNWVVLNQKLMSLDEKNVVQLIEHEKKHKARIRILLRLHNRFSRLRGERERAELASHAKA